MNSMKNKVLLTLLILLMNQNVWSQTIDLYCQGKYQTGELLQLKLSMDILFCMLQKGVIVMEMKIQ